MDAGQRVKAMQLRERLAAATTLDDFVAAADDEVGPFCSAAVRDGHATVDEVAVLLGVSRNLAAAFCGADPSAAVIRLLAGERHNQTPGVSDGWVIAWAGPSEG